MYIGSCAGVFYAFDLHTGEISRQHDVSVDGANQFHSTALITDSLVVVGTDEGSALVGSVYAFDRFTGGLRWRSDGETGLPSNPAEFDSLVLVITQDDNVLALSKSDGHVVWRYDTVWERLPVEAVNMISIARIASSPLVHGERVYMAGRDSTVHCISARDGSPVWKRRLDVTLTTEPLLVDSMVVIGRDDYVLTGLSLESGAIVFEDTLDLIPVGGMAVYDNEIIMLGAHEDARPRDVVVFDPAEHAVTKIFTLDSEDPDAYWYVPRAHVFDGMVVVGSTEGLAIVYDIASGDEIWRETVQQPVRGVGHGDDVLLIGTFNGLLTAYEFVPGD